MTEKRILTNSFEETQTLAFDYAKNLKKGSVLALHGDLGSGKTTFVQGLARGLGIEKKIISPTFIIMRTYGHFYHVDLYRVETEKDVEGLGLLEIINDPENIVVIEWPEKIDHHLPKKTISIEFEYLKDDQRRIIFK